MYEKSEAAGEGTIRLGARASVRGREHTIRSQLAWQYSDHAQRTASDEIRRSQKFAAWTLGELHEKLCHYLFEVTTRSITLRWARARGKRFVQDQRGPAIAPSERSPKDRISGCVLCRRP